MKLMSDKGMQYIWVSSEEDEETLRNAGWDYVEDLIAYKNGLKGVAKEEEVVTIAAQPAVKRVGRPRKLA